MPSGNEDLERIVGVITRLLDKEIMPWLKKSGKPSKAEAAIANAIIGDRVCGALADPLIRNEQEKRQLRSLSEFLCNRGYRLVETKDVLDFRSMPRGTFAHHLNVPAKIGRGKTVNMPIDVVVMRKGATDGDLPLLIECKSAGDFTNTNKRRKEEAAKIAQLKSTYGSGVDFILFLCGYFDSGYLGYEAAEGIEWVWEHRIDDLEKAGV